MKLFFKWTCLFFLFVVFCCMASCGESGPLSETAQSAFDLSTAESNGAAEQSPMPEIIACTSGSDAITGDRFYLLCGKTASAGIVTIAGPGIDTVRQFTGRTRFFIPVYAPVNKNSTVSVTFTATGKEESEAVEYRIEKAGRTPDFSNFSIGSGDNFVHWPDWAGYACNNYLSEEGLANIYSVLSRRFEKIRTAAGQDTQFLLLLAPDPLVLYDESASETLKQMRTEAILAYNRRSGSQVDPDAPIYTAMNQIADYVNAQSPDFTLIDMTPILKELKTEETYPRLYHTTDNHWSSLGAYYGYRELMNIIYTQTGNEGTKPLELSAFDIVENELTFANMAGFPDPWTAGISEIVDLLVPKQERTAQLISGEILNEGRFWSDVRAPMTFQNEGDLPTAVILRDSFATSMYPMLNEHFSWVYYGDTWDYTLDYEWLSAVKPDYVIIIAVERLSMSALQQR